jgi:hypothetical protein
VSSDRALTLQLAAEVESVVRPVVLGAVAGKFASSLRKGDHTLWGPLAEPEASIRLGWVANPESMRPLVAEILALRSELAEGGVDSFVLCGMGGSSLAPEVMAKVHGVALGIVDSTHPDVLTHHLGQDLSRTGIIVSSKSGGTVETDSHLRAFEHALQEQGIDPATRIIVVTDPGSPLESAATAAGYRVFLGDPSIGGRFSALTAFGLVPAGLAGVDVSGILGQAGAVWEALGVDHADNPAVVLGAALAAGHPMRNKILLRPIATLPGLGDWIEQLVAESTGKEGKGLLPVVDSLLGGGPDCLSVGGLASHSDVEIDGTLGGHFLVWEYATAFAGAILGVNPFDQPNVESAKLKARELLNQQSADDPGSEHTVRGAIVFSSVNQAEPGETLEEVLSNALQQLSARSYLALCVFGDSRDKDPWLALRAHLELSLSRPVTLGFGPRFLHSTGQFHKGGPAEGVFVQILEPSQSEAPIPGRDFDFGQLLEAQARGDRAVLSASGQPTFSLALLDAQARERVFTALTG